MSAWPGVSECENSADAGATSPARWGGKTIGPVSKPVFPFRLEQSCAGAVFHTRVVLALASLDLDGLEVTLAGRIVGCASEESPTLQFSNFDVGFPTAPISPGAVLGASGSAGSPIGSGARNCSSSRWRFISLLPPHGSSWGVASYSLFRFSHRAPASAANTRHQFDYVRNWCPTRYRGGLIW